MSKRSLRIIFVRRIPDLFLPLERPKFNWTCENILLKCIQHLKSNAVSSDESTGNDEVNDNDRIAELLPAFGLMSIDGSVYFPPSWVFYLKNDNQTFKFRIRHRPVSSKVFEKSTFFSEFFVLQAIEDLLFGTVGKNPNLPTCHLLELVSLAIFLSSAFPADNAFTFDANYKVKNFYFWNYHRKFTELYKRLMPSIDLTKRYRYYTIFKRAFKKYLLVNQDTKLLDYKRTFVDRLLKYCPWYGFDKLSVLVLEPSGKFREVEFHLKLYDEEEEEKEKVGIFFDEVRHCGLEEIGRLTLKSSGQTDWQVTIVSKYGPMHMDKILLFKSKPTAISFLSMLQGYVTLCVQPQITLCKELTSQSIHVRDELKSFAPMSHKQATQFLKRENQHKQKRYQSRIIIYQSTETLHLFHAASEDHLLYDILWSEDRGYLLRASNETTNQNHSGDVHDLRCFLIDKYGPQLNPKKVLQSINVDSVFYMDKRAPKKFEVPQGTFSPAATSYLMYDDLSSKEPLREIPGSETDPLNRWVVTIKGTEEKRVLLELVPTTMAYIEAVYKSITTIAKLSHLHPNNVLNFYGQLIMPCARLSFLLENSEFGNLKEFLAFAKLSTSCKMEFAQQVVDIFCILTQKESSKLLLHGNLRGVNFYVFKNDKFFLKLGDPGLVHHNNNLDLTYPDNQERIPWLSYERCDKLKEVTLESECYAVATTIAEIFHGTDDFRDILMLSERETLQNYFLDRKMQIPPPSFPESEDHAVMQSVQDVTFELWDTLTLCWDREPANRPCPLELKQSLADIVDKAREIPQETILGHFKCKIEDFYKVTLQGLKTMAECHQFLKEQESLLIEPSEFSYDKSRRLGKGAYGVVYKGQLCESGRPIAIKVSFQKDNISMKEFKEEMKLSGSLKHPNIVECLHFSYFEARPCIIMEFMNIGKLKPFVEKQAATLDSEDLRAMLLKFSLDIAKGMAYLEGLEKPVVHGDLAGRNILLHNPGSGVIAKVADFGLAKILKKGKDYYFTCNSQDKGLPFFWYPPEYLTFERFGQPVNNGITFTSAGDVWAYGTTLWEMFTKGNTPSLEVIRQCGVRVCTGDLLCEVLCSFFMHHRKRWPQGDEIGNEIYSVMLKCWHLDDKRRPTFAELQELIESVI